jgi:hypothetical protein
MDGFVSSLRGLDAYPKITDDFRTRTLTVPSPEYHAP